MTACILVNEQGLLLMMMLYAVDGSRYAGTGGTSSVKTSVVEKNKQTLKRERRSACGLLCLLDVNKVLIWPQPLKLKGSFALLYYDERGRKRVVPKKSCES